MFRKFIFLLIFFVQGLYSFATAQIQDILIYKGEKYGLAVNPMEDFFNEFPEKRPRAFTSALSRGYIATFEIIQNELWVIDIQTPEIINGEHNNNWKSIIRECFNGKDKMRIDRFKGLLVLPQGKVIDYVHLGYASTYEYYTIIEIDNGKFIKELNMNYNQYIEFKDIQFEFFRKTETYKTIFDRIYFNRSLSKFPGHETWLKEDEINNSIKIVLTDYLEKIYE